MKRLLSLTVSIALFGSAAIAEDAATASAAAEAAQKQAGEAAAEATAEASPRAMAPDYKQVQPGDIVYGDTEAPNTIIEYASLSCSHCAEFSQKVMPKIVPALIDTGEAKLIYRHYPLNEPALKAAMMVECAEPEQQKKYIKLLFKTQDKWAFTRDFEGALRTVAKLGGMSGERFDACMEDTALESTIIASRKIGSETFKVQSTPGIIVNGVTYNGPRTVEGFRQFFRTTGGAAAPAADTTEAPGADTGNE